MSLGMWQDMPLTCYIGISATALASLVLCVRKALTLPHGRVAAAAVFIVAIFTLRSILFWNTAAWKIYNEALTSKDVEGREKHVIDYRLYAERDRFKKCKYLAIGTSQSGEIFGYKFAYDSGFECVFMGGLGVWEYGFFRDIIKDKDPDYIVLYLSEFDMARHTDITSIPLTPDRLSHAITIFMNMYRYERFRKDAISFLVNAFMAEVMPEYKYGVIFRDLLNKLMRYRRVFGKRSFEEMSYRELLKIEADNINNNLYEENIAVTVPFLDDFCAGQDVPVIILEGHYNPLLYTQKSLSLNRTAVDEIRKVASKYKNAIFVPRTDLYEFQVNDFRDGYHVTEKPAEEYVKSLFRYLDDLKIRQPESALAVSAR
ncbi:MAG: hypothetical protein PHS37_06585 [Candidatus Omnitrophica bacterium]|nr:hypothetical protein [Candidatus Omnitrophota bacterium]